MSSNYSFDLVPENTLRMTISPLNNQYAIARLLDLDEVPNPQKGGVLSRFKEAIVQMGFQLVVSKELGFVRVESANFTPREHLDALEQSKCPALLVKKIEWEYDPDRF